MENELLNPELAQITRELLARVGFGGEIKIETADTQSLPVLSIESEEDLSILIGKNGQNLNALEHLLRVIAFRRGQTSSPIGTNFVLDINDYRKSKAHYIIELAKTTARRVVSTQRAEALAPMSAYERRLVHTELATHKELQTESIGEEPRRRIVIKPLAL